MSTMSLDSGAMIKLKTALVRFNDSVSKAGVGLQKVSRELTDDCETKCQESAKKITALKSQINTLKKKISDVQSSITRKNTEINTLSTKIPQLESKISYLSNRESYFHRRISELRQQLSQVVDSEGRQRILNRIDSCEDEITQVSNEKNRIKDEITAAKRTIEKDYSDIELYKKELSTAEMEKEQATSRLQKYSDKHEKQTEKAKKLNADLDGFMQSVQQCQSSVVDGVEQNTGIIDHCINCIDSYLELQI